MNIDYENTKKCWRRNKSNLTRAQNRENWQKVLQVCKQAFRDFEAYGYPDDWALFKRAQDDARFKLRFEATETILERSPEPGTPEPVRLEECHSPDLDEPRGEQPQTQEAYEKLEPCSCYEPTVRETAPDVCHECGGRIEARP